MIDHNVSAVIRLFSDQESAAEGACLAAATEHGQADRADLCDDGDVGCPNCPWKTPKEN